jgi:two-component system, cell cycle response regulator
VDDFGHGVTVQERLAAHLDALEFQRSSDVRGRLDAAIELERDAEAAALTTLAMRARLVRADMLHRSGHPSVGATLAMEVNGWAKRNYEQALLARSHLVLSSIHEGIGDGPASLEHAIKAMELADELTSERERGNYILRLADAFALDGSLAAARKRYREAQRTFASLPDPEREMTALNNLSYAEATAGDADAAWACAQQMQTLARRNGFELNPESADTLARAMLGVGLYEEAIEVLEQAEAMLDLSGDVQAATPGAVLLTLAEAQRLRGRLVEAQQALDRCIAVCRERSLVSVEVDAIAEQSEIYAANGRFDEAYATHKAYHARWAKLASSRREAAVQTRQVMFETAEARRNAEQYWRQARTDPLSALPNRRFLDEELVHRLALVAQGEALAVAIVDADHFKRINDTLSHAVGDRAIFGLARVLESSLARRDVPKGVLPPIVGRLGGEEFLVMVPMTDQDPACDILDALRGAVEAQDWTGVGPDLQITVSVGATVARAEDSPADVLRRADAQLYQAKRAGRNRVAFDQPIRGRQPSRSPRQGTGRRKGEAA